MGQVPDGLSGTFLASPQMGGSRGNELAPVLAAAMRPPSAGNFVQGAASKLSNWPQYDPNSAGLNPTAGPFIPQAPAARTVGTDFAARQMQPYGDTNSAGTMMGVKPKRKGK